MKYFNWILPIGVIFFILLGDTRLDAQKTTGEKAQIAVSDISIVKSINSVDTLTFKEELSESGVFGRKIIYRELSAIKPSNTISGRISVKVCIDRAGLVTYVEVNKDETTIGDRQILKSYLKASRGYKFQPDFTAPKEQCGKMSFSVDK